MYSAYCKKHKLKISSDKMIKNALYTLLGVSDDITYDKLGGKRENVWSGIRVKDYGKVVQQQLNEDNFGYENGFVHEYID